MKPKGRRSTPPAVVIRSAMLWKGIRLADLAMAMGATEYDMDDWLDLFPDGWSITVERAEALSELLGMSPGFFLRLQEKYDATKGLPE